jgi:hypothetical protein
MSMMGFGRAPMERKGNQDYQMKQAEIIVLMMLHISQVSG